MERGGPIPGPESPDCVNKMIMISESGEEISRIVSDAVPRTLEFFSENGPLREAEKYGGQPYERRIQQEEMALRVATALEMRRNLCVEAPTGVGKSFAYLIPAIYHALAMRTPVLITTETINLQEQLVSKDLPLLKKLTDLNFTFVIAKGRGNYLCLRRLSLALGEHRRETLPGGIAQQEVEQLRDWAQSTKDGSRADISFRLDPLLWTSVCSESASCTGPKCSHYRACFYWKARHQWDKADLIVTNHALFFTDLKMRELEEQETAPLPTSCAVIFDEAHTLEDNAAKHLGIHVNSSSLRFFLNRLFNPLNGRGLLMKPGEHSLTIRGLIARIQEETDLFFQQFETALEHSPEHCFRILRKGLYRDTLSDSLSELENVLHEYAEEQEEAEFKAEILSHLDKCTAYRESIGSFMEMSCGEDHVYWVEGRTSARTGGSIVDLNSAPLNVSSLLEGILFSGDVPVVLTSATLAVKGRLDYYTRRTGFANGDTMILDSPFDFRSQVKLYLSKRMPFPHEKEYNEEAAGKISEFVSLTEGRAFVLFTNYSMLRQCAERLHPEFRKNGIVLLEHGESSSRTALLNEFKQSRRAVIFGATSFWTGVDVPGNALSNVIITKLPFAVPSHPLIQARCERIRAEGGDPFSDYSLPDAVLKFRQGVGRLIRSRTDKGIIVILDPRIVTKQYGRLFLNSLPPCPVEYF